MKSMTQQVVLEGTIPSSRSTRLVWTGRVISILVTLFLAFDSVTKLIKDPRVLAASADLGYSVSSIVLIGAVLLVCTSIYIIPRASILGAILLTGYLGGAVASNLRVGHPIFECIFPILFGILVWAGLLLRNRELREFVMQQM